jgi:plasmid maintenance system killer protein
MEILFKDKKLQKNCENARNIRRAFGDRAEKISQRLQELHSAESLMDISRLPAPRLHPLADEYKGCFAVDIKQPFRIIFKPLNGDHSDYLSMTRIEIIAIKDYH